LEKKIEVYKVIQYKKRIGKQKRTAASRCDDIFFPGHTPPALSLFADRRFDA